MSMEPSRKLTLYLHYSGSIYHVATDMRGRYTYANELYKKIFFKSSDNYHDETFESSLFPDDIELYNDAKNECLSEPDKSSIVDLRRYRNDGSQFWIRWEICAIVDNEQVA